MARAQSKKERARIHRHDVYHCKPNINCAKCEYRPGEIAVQPTAPTRVHKTSDAHD